MRVKRFLYYSKTFYKIECTAISSCLPALAVLEQQD